MLGNDFLAALFRSPRLVEALCVRVGDQMQRLTAQLVICQLPRVDDRVLSMMWLLADAWGQVTPSGVRLPLALTHETLGALVGARRPTVTLALRKLGQQGAIVQQDSGWLLLAAPPDAGQPQTNLPAPPQPTAASPGFWAPDPDADPAPDLSQAYVELRDTFRQLRDAHRTQRQATRNRLAMLQGDRVRLSAARKRIAQDAVRRRQPPSS
jgi:hypothetical protein